MKRPVLVLALLPFFAAGCEKKDAAPTPVPSASAELPPTARLATAKLDKVTRTEFNRLAAEVGIPLFWIEDKNKNNGLDPDELAVYWGLEPGSVLAEYVGKDGFTQKMLDAYDRIVKQKTGGAAPDGGAADEEHQRRELVKKELSQGRVTLVETDLTNGTPAEKRFVSFIMKASEMIEKVYAKQQGTTDLAKKVPSDDPASKTLFFRGQGPKCEAPLTQDEKLCGALPAADMPKGKISGLYPADLLTKPKFCEELAKKSKDLVDPFTVVTSTGDPAPSPKETEVGAARLAQLKATPYSEAYKDDLEPIATELKAAASALGETEPALREYLLAAAKAFTDNNWWPADEAWAKMDAKNSKFYLRIAPDEVYDEPCSTKALFHVSFGLINQGSLKWQLRLDPLKTEMEKTLAELAGPPYKAREVSFKLPDFVDIAINAGDSRKAFGATIGQSLPNFGPVANGGKGRTVAMTNFYLDADSIAAAKSQAESLFCKNTMSKYVTEPEPQLMSTVLHEAAHNLGPAHQYKANGKIDRDAFGGPLASTLEELKAQTSALFFTDWLVEKGTITKDEGEKAHVRDVFWAFGHISRGMWTDDKHPKNYSQLAAIQLGALMKAGAIEFKAEEVAASGGADDKGCFDVDLAKMPGAVKTLMIEVAQIKGRGDKARAEALQKQHVPAPGQKNPLHETITQRMTRAPKASFVYAIKLDATEVPKPAASGSAPAGSAAPPPAPSK